MGFRLLIEVQMVVLCLPLLQLGQFLFFFCNFNIDEILQQSVPGSS